MYKVLGADQKEYGPVTAEQIRQWIGENRLNAQSLVQAEGSPDWRPLSQVPEFSALVGGPPLAGTPSVLKSTMPAAVHRTNSMAVAGLIMGVLSISTCFCYCFPFGVLGIIFSLVALSQIKKNPEVEQGRGMAIAGLILSIIGLLLVLLLALLPIIFGLTSNFDPWRRSFKWQV